MAGRACSRRAARHDGCLGSRLRQPHVPLPHPCLSATGVLSRHHLQAQSPPGQSCTGGSEYDLVRSIVPMPERPSLFLRVQKLTRHPLRPPRLCILEARCGPHRVLRRRTCSLRVLSFSLDTVSMSREIYSSNTLDDWLDALSSFCTMSHSSYNSLASRIASGLINMMLHVQIQRDGSATRY
jgi:hypothetical protein